MADRSPKKLPAGLEKVFGYDPLTGDLHWLIHRPNKGIKPGDIAGNIQKTGYRRLEHMENSMLAHRIAWLLYYGEEPNMIDHINGNRADNRIENLRSVTPRVNSQNRRRPQKDTRSGFLGVDQARGTKNWRASIQTDGKRVRLGSYETREEAYAAYVAAKQKYHEGCTLSIQPQGEP